MTSYWKRIQYIDHANNIKKTLELLKYRFLQFSQWKNNSITNVTREKYKVGNNGMKKEVVNNIYNLMMLIVITGKYFSSIKIIQLQL